MMKTPLAWLNLQHEINRLGVAIAGVGFAVMIMFMNLGFLGALSNTAAQMYGPMNGDLFLVSPKTVEISTSFAFDIDRLYQAAGFRGVQRVMPLYVNYLQWQNPETREKRSLLVYAVNPQDPAFSLAGYQDPQNRLALRRMNTVLIDRRSRGEFGPLTVGLTTQAGQRQVTIGGLYDLGGGFSADATAIMSDQNFRRFFANRPLNLIDLGLIQLEPGYDPHALATILREQLPKDVKVFTKQELIQRDRDYWINSTSIGFIFSLGVAVAGVVGVVIVYQILYTDITDHMKQYATLKAIGYSNQFLCGVVLQEALILSGLGYGPGLFLSWIFYQLTVQATGGTLPVSMTLPRMGFVLALAIVMCSISGLISLQRVIQADPADVFN